MDAQSACRILQYLRTLFGVVARAEQHRREFEKRCRFALLWGYVQVKVLLFRRDQEGARCGEH
jgi:hypothetical protein